MPELLKLHWRNHTSSNGEFVRVWREDWAGDMFEVIHRTDFKSFQSLLHDTVEFIEHGDDED